MAESVIPWREVQEPRAVNGDLAQALATVDSLQRAWEEVVGRYSIAEFAEARQRSLRRHAIETGVIERLYDVDWGVTEALVAEGLSAEVAAREGGLEAGALETIRAQFEALRYVADAAQPGEPLTTSFIRQLHQAIRQTQSTFDGVDQLGRPSRRPLKYGAWKSQPNFARRADGTRVEFAPPEHVQSEMERVLAFEASSRELHPLVRAAWLHHAFVRIHPFDDGNGRVGRALAMLVLLQSHYAPLVVDRSSRQEYIAALDAANDDDLRPLVRLFVRLEIVALRSELERPALPSTTPSSAVEVARAFVDRRMAQQADQSAALIQQVERLATKINAQVEEYVRAQGKGLAEQFRALDARADDALLTATPPHENSLWWRAQIIKAARYGDFFTNIEGGTWWTYLRIRTLGQQLRYVVVIQKVGRGETGVLALTAFSETVLDLRAEDHDPHPQYRTLLPTSEADADSVTFVHSDVDDRWAEVTAVIDRTLAAAVAGFAQGFA